MHHLYTTQISKLRITYLEIVVICPIVEGLPFNRLVQIANCLTLQRHFESSLSGKVLSWQQTAQLNGDQVVLCFLLNRERGSRLGDFA